MYQWKKWIWIQDTERLGLVLVATVPMCSLFSYCNNNSENVWSVYSVVSAILSVLYVLAH